MLRAMLKSKIHRATVTGADPDQVGSLCLDADLLDAAGLLPGERVAVVAVASGARVELDVAAGPRGSGVVDVGGGQPGEQVIVCSYALMDTAQAALHRPRVVRVDGDNRVVAPDAEPAPAPGEQDVSPAETEDAARLDALLSTES
jgi:aspartate 1-decarboxylase